MFLHHLNELNIEDESCKGRNRTACTTLAVCQTIGDEETILGALLHQLQTLSPTSNDLLQSKHGRLATLDTAIEYGTINSGISPNPWHWASYRYLLSEPDTANQRAG